MISLPSLRRADYAFTHDVRVKKPKKSIDMHDVLARAVESAQGAKLSTAGLRGRVIARQMCWGLEGLLDGMFKSTRWTVGLRAIGVMDAQRGWDQHARVDAIVFHEAVFPGDAERAYARTVSVVSLLDARGKTKPISTEASTRLEVVELPELSWTKFKTASRKVVTYEQWKRVPAAGT